MPGPASDRPTTIGGTELRRRDLIAAGFSDLERALQFLDSHELEGSDRAFLLRSMRSVADADQALLLLLRLLDRAPQLQSLVVAPSSTDTPAGERQLVTLLRLLGASEALAEFLIRRPEHLDLILEPEQAASTAPALYGLELEPEDRDPAAEVRRLLLEAVGADADSQNPPRATLTGKDAAVALRVAYRRQIVAITLQDVMSPDPVEAQPAVSRWLADIAAAAVEAALAVARAEAVEKHGDAVDQVRLSVLGMGKCGARELNYISDVDVIFVHEEPEEHQGIAEELAAGISVHINRPAAEPGLWEVDANLRPEGKDGALTRTVESHLEYYRRWAHTWEFQALLKARPIAGDAELAQQYLDGIHPLVWDASSREGFVEQVRSMRRRVMDNIASRDKEREIKLGAGGLRDVEFSVQLLQLVHGKTDETLHVHGTEDAITALRDGVYIGRADAEDLARAYRYLRLLEHRIQLVHMRRTHLMPEQEEALRVLARAIEPADRPAAQVMNAAQLQASWHQTRRRVQELHQRIFYRPLLSSVASLSADEVQLTPEAVQQRLAALGYRAPAGAMRHIEALSAGVSRRATLQRQLLPALLAWMANGADPDGGLLGFRRLSESLGNSPWFLRMLRDSSAAAERLCHVLSSSRFLSDMLEHAPDAAAWLDQDRHLVPRSLEDQLQEMRAVVVRHPKADSAMRQVRLIRRREILRTALSDATGVSDLKTVCHALADIDQAAVVAALKIVVREAGEDRAADLAIVAMGRQGGREITYGSDLDVMFVQRATGAGAPEDAQKQGIEMAKRLTTLLKAPLTPAIPLEPLLMIDADLRPEGKKGPLVRSLDSYREYYHRWGEIWEVQALLRARPIAGPDDFQQEFTAWADSVRYDTEVAGTQLREIRRIKARVEAERLPRGADPARHIKLGRGGLSDVEWLVQTLQLQHAGDYESLHETGTMPALEALTSIGALDREESSQLAEAWRLATRVRAASVLWTGKTSDVLPTNRDDLEAIARWCGYEPGSASELEEDYLRTTRRARSVFDRRFYGV